MTIAIYIGLVIASILKKKSKVITFLILLFMWTMGTFCVGIADEDIYYSRYTSPWLWSSVTEYGFNLLINICRTLRLSYTGFRGVIIGLELLLIKSTVCKYAKYPNLVLLMLLICPYPLNMAQLRSSLATAVIIFSLRYLIEDNKYRTKLLKIKLNDLLFAAFILIAALIHASSILWLLLLIAKKCNTREIVIFVIIFNIFVYFLISPDILYRILMLFKIGERIGAYLTPEYASSVWRHKGPVVYVFFVSSITLVIINYISHREYLRHALTPMDEILLSLCRNINIVMLALVAIVLRYTSEVTRIQEGITVFNYIVLTNSLNRSGLGYSRLSKGNLYLLLLICFYLVVYVYLLIIHYLTDSVWIPFWFGNSLLHL